MIVSFDMGEFYLVKQIRESGTPVINLPVGRFYNFNALKKAFALYKIIKKNHIGLVQTYHIKSDVYGVFIARFSGVSKIISSKRDTGDLKSGLHYFLNRLVNPLITGFIVVANAVGKVVSKKEKISPDKITTIYNGVDLKKCRPPDEKGFIESRKKLGLSAADFVVGTVAWFRLEKNYDIFFNAIERASKTIPNLKVVAVGGGDLLEAFRESSKARGFLKQVIFTGAVEDVSRYLQVMDVACLVPGKNEGFSNSILEKMATGLPMIVSDVGGNAEAVIDGYNGIVISPNDSVALAEAIIHLYGHPEKRKMMGFNSRKRVEEMFSIQRMVQQHEEYYEKIMAMS